MIIDYYKKTNVSLEQVAVLIRDSFVERQEQGLNMDGCTITSEKIKGVIDNGSDIVLAFDSDSKTLVGADIVEIKSYRGGITYIIGLQQFALVARGGMWRQL